MLARYKGPAVQGLALIKEYGVLAFRQVIEVMEVGDNRGTWSFPTKVLSQILILSAFVVCESIVLNGAVNNQIESFNQKPVTRIFFADRRNSHSQYRFCGGANTEWPLIQLVSNSIEGLLCDSLVRYQVRVQADMHVPCNSPASIGEVRHGHNLLPCFNIGYFDFGNQDIGLFQVLREFKLRLYRVKLSFDDISLNQIHKEYAKCRNNAERSNNQIDALKSGHSMPPVKYELRYGMQIAPLLVLAFGLAISFICILAGLICIYANRSFVGLPLVLLGIAVAAFAFNFSIRRLFFVSSPVASLTCSEDAFSDGIHRKGDRKNE